MARSERNDSALSRARLGKPGEVFSHEAKKNDTMIFQKCIKKARKILLMEEIPNNHLGSKKNPL